MQFDQNWSKEDEHFFHKNCQFESNKPVISENSVPTVPTHQFSFDSVPIHRCPLDQCPHAPVPFPSVSPYTGALSISVSIHWCPFDQFTLPQGCINGNKLPYIQSTSVVRHHNELLLHNQNESRVRYIFVTIQFLPLLLVTIGILFTKKSTTKTFVFATPVH